MSRTFDCAIGNVLLDFLYHRNQYKLIGIDSSRKTNMNNSQIINFKGKLEEGNDGATLFFVVKKQPKTVLNFSVDSLHVTE